MSTKGRYCFDLKTYELDFRKRIPVYVITRFMQEAAENHAVDRGFDTETLLRRGLTWVLVKLHLVLSSYPEGRQVITIETWASGVESRLAFREFRIFAENAPEPCAVASSTWMLIDVAKQRPVVLAPLFPQRVLFSTEKLVALDMPMGGNDAPLLQREIPVRVADIDINGHVNNIHYVEWLLEALPEDVWREQKLTELQAEYKRPAMYGDTVLVESFRRGDGFSHRMTSSSSRAELFRAATRWRSCRPFSY